MDMTRQALTNVAQFGPTRVPMGQFAKLRTYLAIDDHTVRRKRRHALYDRVARPFEGTLDFKQFQTWVIAITSCRCSTDGPKYSQFRENARPETAPSDSQSPGPDCRAHF